MRPSDPTLADDDLIALGLDPTTGHQEGHAQRVRARLPAIDRGQPAGRPPRISVRLSHRVGGTSAAGHLQLLRRVGGRTALSCRSANRMVRGEPAASSASSTDRGNDGEQCAVLEEVFSRRRDQPARVGAVRGEPAQRVGGCRSAATACLAVSAELRAVLRRQAGRRAVRRRRQRLGPSRMAHRLRRAARARRAQACGDQTPVGPIRFDFGYQLNRD